MSTYLDFSVQTREEFRDWIITMLGEDLTTVELTQKQLDVCINNAVEEFTKWVSQEQNYYAMNLEEYEEDLGHRMPDNVTGCFSLDDNYVYARGGVNTLFSIPNAMWNAGLIPNFTAGKGSGWTTYEMAMESLDLTRIMTGKGFWFEYNPRTKYVKLVPDPVKENLSGYVIFGTFTIRPETQQYGESWVRKYALAEAKILLGTIRGKFDGVQLLGGGNINASIKEDGISERDKLIEDIRLQESGPYGFFVG